MALSSLGYRTKCVLYFQERRSQVFCGNRLLITARSGTIASAPTSGFSIPSKLLQRIREANQSWVDSAVAFPLVEPDLHAQIILLGVVPFAPLQETAVQRLLDVINPQAVALEYPSSLPGRDVILPYPEVLQLLLDVNGGLQAAGFSGDPDPKAVSEEAALITELASPELALSARVGRDIMDPYEAVGLYPAMDYIRSPSQIATAAQLFGYLPGSEQAAALRHALESEAEVLCVDAAVRAQEAWVSSLVSTFTMQEADLARQFGREVATVQDLVAPEHLEFDIQLAKTVPQDPSVRSNDDAMLVCYKVSKACAAATLPAGPKFDQAVALQAGLQPLKYRHFDMRALHIAKQLREICRQRATAATIAVKLATPAGNTSSTGQQPPASSASNPSSPSPSASKTSSSPTTTRTTADDMFDDTGRPKAAALSATGQPFTLLAVVGRQYIPTMRRLWSDPSSALWKGDVPRTFAKSTIEPVSRPLGDLDPDTDSGGSRPVGQVPINLGQAMKQQQQRGPGQQS